MTGFHGNVRVGQGNLSTPPTDKSRRHSGGRPSHGDAIKRDERLIAIAASMFMERGFEGTSIDAVAEAAGVGKATLYARYKDKGELFAAVLQRKIDRWLAENETADPKLTWPGALMWKIWR